MVFVDWFEKKKNRRSFDIAVGTYFYLLVFDSNPLKNEHTTPHCVFGTIW